MLPLLLLLLFNLLRLLLALLVLMCTMFVAQRCLHFSCILGALLL